MFHAVITAGGTGERFWPMSCPERPKQLLCLLGDRSMIRLTIDRLKPMFPPERTWVVTGRDMGAAIRAELPDIPPDHVLLEPRRCNTAPAIGLALVKIRRNDPDATMLVQAADHAITGEDAFLHTLVVAEAHARETGRFVTCGFIPTRVGPGFGHIEVGELLEVRGGLPIHRAERFVEKPPYEEARRLTESGRYWWNSGIFVWRLRTLWEAYQQNLPDLAARLQRFEAHLGTPAEGKALDALYQDLPAVPVEKAILEGSSNIAVLPGKFVWEDVGSWEGLRSVHPLDEQGNLIRGDVLVRDSRDCTIVCEDGTVAVLGVDNLVVVKSGDKVLVCRRDRSEEVKSLLHAYRQRRAPSVSASHGPVPRTSSASPTGVSDNAD